MIEQPPNETSDRPSGRLDRRPHLTSDDPSVVAPTVPLGTSGNPRRARARTLLSRLSARDHAILGDLARFRLMSGRQLQQLHVVSDQPTTAARRTRAVLHRLSSLGVVVRLERRIGGIQAGSEGHVYGLSGLGRAVLTQTGVTVHGRTTWETKPAFQDHLLAIGELYVGLRQLERQARLELLDFETEPDAWRSFAGPSGEALPVKPDAVAAVGIGELEQVAFVEIDCGTESLPTIARKCQRYLAYWRSGVEQHRSGLFPRVWWLTHTARRKQRLRTVVDQLARDEQPLFAVGLAGDGPRLLAGLAAPGGQS